MSVNASAPQNALSRQRLRKISVNLVKFSAAPSDGHGSDFFTGAKTSRRATGLPGKSLAFRLAAAFAAISGSNFQLPTDSFVGYYFLSLIDRGFYFSIATSFIPKLLRRSHR
jgi:hypothetical protein